RGAGGARRSARRGAADALRFAGIASLIILCLHRPRGCDATTSRPLFLGMPRVPRFATCPPGRYHGVQSQTRGGKAHAMALAESTALSFPELQSLLQATDPRVLLVPPRVLRRVIKRDRKLTGIGLVVPHRKSYCIDRDSLLRHADLQD